MIEIQVNGEQQCCQAETLGDALNELGYADAIVATALNGQFIAQSMRDSTQLKQGDKLEVLAPMQGG